MKNAWIFGIHRGGESVRATRSELADAVIGCYGCEIFR